MVSRCKVAADALLIDAARLAWRVKLSLHLSLDLMNDLRERAEAQAIHVFARNLKDLLLAAPAGARPTMGLDPGIRTGVKVAVVDGTGKLLETATVYPFQPRNDVAGAIAELGRLIQQHRVELIAIGNGTASRETDQLVADVIAALPAPKPIKVVVSEAGASVYSASATAAAELPDLDVSLRGAVSIARRLQIRWPSSSRSSRRPSASDNTSTTSIRPGSPAAWTPSSKMRSTRSASISTRLRPRCFRACPGSAHRSPTQSSSTGIKKGLSIAGATCWTSRVSARARLSFAPDSTDSERIRAPRRLVGSSGSLWRR